MVHVFRVCWHWESIRLEECLLVGLRVQDSAPYLNGRGNGGWKRHCAVAATTWECGTWRVSEMTCTSALVSLRSETPAALTIRWRDLTAPTGLWSKECPYDIAFLKWQRRATAS